MGEWQSHKAALTEVEIPSVEHALRGSLCLPAAARAIVIFAHGSGSSRFSPRNRFVAESIQKADLGTLLIDLLDEQEASDRALVFDVELLARRLQSAVDWLTRQPGTRRMKLGYFGASTGAGAALLAAARAPDSVAAVVSRGGRPDLARCWLSRVAAPTLLIVGGADAIVLDLNRAAIDLLKCPRRLEIVPNASHLFPEPGAIDEVARLAKEWFSHYLCEHSS